MLSLLLGGLWLLVLLNFLAMFTPKGWVHYRAMVARGIATHKFGPTVVASWFMVLFVGIFAHSAIFGSVLSYVAYIAFPEGFVYAVESFLCKYFTLHGFFYW